MFYNSHKLDYYEDDIEYKRFDENLPQALAWKRLEAGKNFYTNDDVDWLKHECAERHYELNRGKDGIALYSESHRYSQRHFDGQPWTEVKDFIKNYCAE